MRAASHKRLTLIQSGVAAMLLDGESRSKVIGSATCRAASTIDRVLHDLRRMYGVKTTLGLALALQREEHDASRQD